jgi:hypothetical protein
MSKMNQVSRINGQHRKMEAEVRDNNAFVKRSQNERSKMSGKAPVMSEDLMQTNAVQVNTGAHAERLARELTKGLDKKAFPVK